MNVEERIKYLAEIVANKEYMLECKLDKEEKLYEHKDSKTTTGINRGQILKKEHKR